ncbi:MAG TPA: hypothetical protein VGF94_30155 [Kofleriaceae bacterium]|jgi:hypothetical protein
MRALAGAVLVALAVAAGSLAYSRWSSRREVDTATGQPMGALVVAGEPGFVVVIDRVGGSARGGSYRFTALDPASGAVVASRVIDEPVRCWPGTPARMWCTSGDQTHLVAVPSFDAVTAGPADEASRTWLGRPDGGCAFADVAGAAGAPLSFAPGIGTAPRALQRGSGSDAALAPDAPEFVSPSFLRVEDAALVLVQHDAAIDHPGAIALSRIASDLHVAWTAALGGRCESAHVVGDRLVVTSPDPAHRALAIELATGRVAWTYGR